MASAQCIIDIGARTAEGMARKKARLEVYSPIPYGYDRCGQTLHPNKEEQGVIQQVRSWRSNGWSLQRIANQLIDLRVPTKSGAQWWASTIRYMLQNPLHGPTMATAAEGDTIALNWNPTTTTGFVAVSEAESQPGTENI